VGELDGERARVLVATAQLIGEGSTSAGFPRSPCDTHQVHGQGQAVHSRILRVSEGKREAVIYDYLDHNGILKNSFHSRMIAYHELGVRFSGQ
jgi:hypothetical protein